MFLLQLLLNGIVPRFFITLFVLMLMSCGGGGSSSVNTAPVDNKGGISLPQGLKTALPNNGTLNAYIIVDGGERQLMTIEGDNAVISLTGVTEAQHDYIIEFEFVLDTNVQDPLLLARAEKRLLVGPGVNPLVVDDTDYITDFDLDNDSVSNLSELDSQTSPFAGFRTSLSGNTTEGGGTATYTLALTRQPTANVVISLNSSNANEGTLNRNVLTFTVDNWDQDQSITLTGIDDQIADGNAIFEVVLNSVISDDINYNGEVFASVAVTNNDDETVGYNVSPISGDTDENGGTATFTVRLNKQPTAGSRVRFNVTSSDPSEGIVNVTRLIFTDANWDIPQTVIVTGQDDNVDDDFHRYRIILAAAVSQDPAYNGLKPDDVFVTNLDNDDLPTVTFDVSPASIAEGGSSVITVSMNIASSQTVTVTLGYSGTATDTADYTVDTTAIVILAGSLSATRTLTAIQDNQVEPSETIDIIVSAVNQSAQLPPIALARQITIQGNDLTIGGEIFGLVTNDVVVLQNNGGDDLALNANGGFTFTTSLASGSTYSVTLLTPPANKNCVIQNASGTINSANVTNLIVNCFALDLMKAIPGSKRVTLDSLVVGADTYNIYYSTQKGFDIGNSEGSTLDVRVNPLVVTALNGTTLSNGTPYYFVLEMVFGSETVLLPEISSRPNELSFNGSVNAMVPDADGTLYLGGDFTSVGTYMGANIPLKATTGKLAWGDFPIVEGSVFTTIPDGSGGWYMGGDFIRVGGVARNGLVHVLSDKTVDPSFNPNVTGVVNAISLGGGLVYIGGDFTAVGVSSRNNLAAVDAGGLATVWNPNSNGVVNTLVINAGVIYTGGAFTTIGGVTRNRLAAINTAGSLITTWNPNADGIVKDLVVDATSTPSVIYFVGEFTNIGTTIRNRAASVDSGGTLTSCVYLGGLFTTVSSGSSRTNLAAFNSGNNAIVATWNPSANSMDGPVNTIAVNTNGVYIGGLFNVIGGLSRSNLVRVGLDGVIDDAFQDANAQVSSLSLDADRVYVGGPQLTSIGATTRNRLASINSDATLNTWNPNANGSVNALTLNGGVIYAGGAFTSIGTNTRNRLAAIDTAGVPTAWNPNANGLVNALAIDAATSTVYAGGVFTSLFCGF